MINSRGVPRAKKRDPILRPPGAGRAYPMGPVHAVFKADGDETRRRYSISEWWLEPYTRGPGAHSHDEDDVFYVIEGTGAAWARVIGRSVGASDRAQRGHD